MWTCCAVVCGNPSACSRLLCCCANSQHISSRLLSRLAGLQALLAAGKDHYGKYKAPFDLPTTSLTCRDWWTTIEKDEDAVFVAELAGMLLDVVPHAAGPERVFSLMGWYEGSTSNSMAPSTTAKNVAIKLHYDAVDPPKCRCDSKRFLGCKYGLLCLVVDCACLWLVAKLVGCFVFHAAWKACLHVNNPAVPPFPAPFLPLLCAGA